MTKITKAKIKRELVKNYGWTDLDIRIYDLLISDTTKIVNKILKENKV